MKFIGLKIKIYANSVSLNSVVGVYFFDSFAPFIKKIEILLKKKKFAIKKN